MESSALSATLPSINCSTTRCCCCSIAARMRPASSRCWNASSSCTRPRAWCATCSARATCARCPATSAWARCAIPTAGNAYSEEEAQPFYVNAPFGIVLVHNGNLTNAHALRAELFSTDHRHTNTESDSEVLLNVLAHELERATRGGALNSAERVQGGAQRAPAPARLLRRGGDDRRTRPAGLPRPLRHSSARDGPRAPTAP